MSNHNPENELGVTIKSREDVTEPPMYKVLLHNDDYTTMDFVIEILMAVFRKSHEEATQVMFNVHKLGVGTCGVYTYELAETKVDTVHMVAQENGFPLKSSMEKE